MKSLLNKFTVKVSLLTIVSILSLISIVETIMMEMDAMDSQEQTEIAVQTNLISNGLLKAAGNWAVERGVTSASLNGNEEISMNNRKIIDARRGVADEAYSNAIDKITENNTDFKNKNVMLNQLKENYSDVLQLRKRVDSALMVTKGNRDVDLLENFVPTMTRLIMQSRDLRSTMANELILSLSLSKLNSLKHFSWVTSEYAGRERAVIGGLISSNTQITPEKLQSLALLRGRVDEAWKTMQDLAQSEVVSDSVRQSISNAEKGYFVNFENIRKDVYSNGISGQYQLNTAEWVTNATNAIDSLLAVQTAITTNMNDVSTVLAAEANQTFISSMIFLVLIILITVGSFLIVIKRVSTPIVDMTSVMSKLADGKYETDVIGLDRTDEIGQMASAVQIFKESGIENIKLQEAAEASRKQKELEETKARKDEELRKDAETRKETESSHRAEQERKQSRLDLADGFEDRISGVLNAVTTAIEEMSTSAAEMSRNANDTSSQATSASSASQQAGSNVQTVAGASEEMSASVNEISSQVTEAARISDEAVSDASLAAKQVDDLSNATSKIDEVVNLINDIAEQTNLLALNATIEAARAGDAGKGFAVVASEVKALATQTANATRDIATQIQEVQSVTKDAVTSVEGISTTISRLNEISLAVASAVEEQAAATQEISRNSLEAATRTEAVGENIANVSSYAESTGSAATQVQSAAESLSGDAENLRTEIEGFLSEVRTG